MIALNGLILIVVSIFIGTHILAFFGISLPVVQVGGGLVVISTGWTLLRQPDQDAPGEKDADKECNEANYARQAFYPLTLPLTVGPGSISVAIAVGANRPEGSEWHWPLIAGMLLGSLCCSDRLLSRHLFTGVIASPRGSGEPWGIRP
jgi:multiple antibiotic resistance protein